MSISKEDTILFILKHDPSLIRKELEKLSLTELIIIKTRIEIEKQKK